jgi:hypothetical protein
MAIAIEDGRELHRDMINSNSAADRRRFCDAVARLAGVPADELFQRWNSEITQKADEADRQAEEAARNAAPAAEADPLADSREALGKMPPEIVAEAEAMLADPNLLYLVLDDIAAVGVAGEGPLALTLYLVGTSRLLDRPLAAIVQGPSASGKSYLAAKVADLFPEEALLRATDLTANALYYLRPGSLRHRFVVAGERKRAEDDETADGTRALREMLTAGKLAKAVTVKRPDGSMTTDLIRQDGPIAYVETTSLMKVFEEDANRCLLLTTDETPAQTREILSMLGARYAGARLADEGRIVARHHALQRLLERRPVLVPYAPRLGELIDTRRVEVRRVFAHVLGVVQAAALLHQRQRPTTGDGAILATEDDYQLARYLLAGPMARQLADKVSDGAMRFLDRLLEWFGPGRDFTKPEAHKREGGSQSTVYGWIAELVRHHVIELVEEHRGAIAAKYRLPTKPPTEGMNPLPAPEDVFPVT